MAQDNSGEEPPTVPEHEHAHSHPESTPEHGHGHQAHTPTEDHIPSGHHEVMFANIKEGFDEHRSVWMAHFNQNQANRDADAEQRRSHREESFSLRLQHAQNAVTTAKLTDLALLRAAGIELDRIWNIDETTKALTQSDVARDAIRAMIVDILGDMAGQSPASPAPSAPGEPAETVEPVIPATAP